MNVLIASIARYLASQATSMTCSMPLNNSPHRSQHVATRQR